MNIQQTKELYAKVIVGAGVDVKAGQLVHIKCPVEVADFGRLVAQKAFEAGARDVFVDYFDTNINRLRFMHATDESLSNPPPYLLELRKHFIDNGAALIAMDLVDTKVYEGINPRKIGMYNGALSALIGPANRNMFPNKCTFTAVYIPNQTWADLVFPNEPNSLEKLWEKVGLACRIDKPDPVQSWRDHLTNMKRVAKVLKEFNFKTLRFTSEIGTDLTMDLPPKHIWNAAAITHDSGLPTEKIFFPNLPTEEIFSAPDRLTLNGKAVASMPLVHSGQVVKDFWFEFKDGAVLDYDAKVGRDTLKTIIETDEFSKYIGEVALVQYDSPISRLNTLFYTTLFDENAACHLALGNSYSNCLEGSRGMTPEQLRENGLNTSKVHVDFMIGTKAMNVIGIDNQGKSTYILKDGNWAI